eukprot:TRINITY_DN106805_c0_g1_i1.p1 TRINITY_DN106805_c0_g1~~TRINITY_DN106805_c0_g1_i1.p1  ORF type:complete len:1409 (-),score=319.95 TRINITY_DN106805_c0_g1_i1:109-4335(-)
MASRDGVQTCMSTQSLDAQKERNPDDGGESVRVYVRVRPLAERELTVGSQQALSIDSAIGSVVIKGDPPRSFAFDGVLSESASQEDVFEAVGRSVGASCLAGYNGSVYVYGQTGAGKTHTMSGPITSVQSMQFDERRGIICRMLDYVFSEVGRRRAESDGAAYSCRCSFLEIYKEQITDLLEPSNTNLQVREDMNRGVYVERLSEPTVSSLTEAFQALWRGLQQRHVGSTHMNERSSRSHAVFTLYVEAARTRAGVTSTRVASLSLVDLAGSERQQHAGDPGTSLVQPYESLRVKEAGAINKSLSALTNVIMSLSREERSRRRSNPDAERSGRRSGNFVHYRDSKLTFLLRDSLGGNSKTVIVANVSPSHLCVAETLSTLKFAARAKHIRCAVVRNEAFSGTVESLMQEVKALRQQLSDLSCGDHGFSGLSSRAEENLLASPSSILEDVEAIEEDEPEAEDTGLRENEDSNQEAGSGPLFSRRRVRRLEVLLAAALQRERDAEQRRHRLQRLARFLEDLEFRKGQSLRKLYTEYWSQINSQVQVSAITDDIEIQELSAKVLSFGKLLGNLVGGSVKADPAQDTCERHLDSDEQSTDAPSQGPGAADLAAAEEVAAASAEVKTAAISGDEAAFIREENRLLRRQLENHAEVQRLTAENWALRERLRSIDPAGWPDMPSSALRSAEQSNTLAEEGRDTVLGVDLREASESIHQMTLEEEPTTAAGSQPALRPPPSLSSEVMLRAIEVDDESSLRTWFYFQKMAKEVEELLRAKENLSCSIQQVRESQSSRHSPEKSFEFQDSSPERQAQRQKAASKSPTADTRSKRSTVDFETVQDLDIATRDALNLAHSLLNGAGAARLPSLTAGRATGRTGAKEVDDGGYDQSLLMTPPSSAGAFSAWPQEQVGGAVPSRAELSDQERLKQALHRVKQLQGTVDLVNAAYGDAFDQFHRLREEYESRLEECQFFELQCSRLNLACHDLAERLRPPGAAAMRPRPGFSTTGLWQQQSPTDRQKRSFSMSSLRDEGFWEQRFQELRELTGADMTPSPLQESHARTPGSQSKSGSDVELPVPTLAGGRLPLQADEGSGVSISGPATAPVAAASAGSLLHSSASLSSLRMEDSRLRAQAVTMSPTLAAAARSGNAVPATVVRRVASAPSLPAYQAVPVASIACAATAAPLPAAKAGEEASAKVPGSWTANLATNSVSPAPPPVATAAPVQTAPALVSAQVQPPPVMNSSGSHTSLLASPGQMPAATPTTSTPQEVRHDNRSRNRGAAPQPAPPVLTLPRRLGEPSGVGLGGYGSSGSISARAGLTARFRSASGAAGPAPGGSSSSARPGRQSSMVNVPSVAAAAAAAAAAATGSRSAAQGQRGQTPRSSSRGYERARQVGQGHGGPSRGQPLYMPPSRHGAG